MDGRVIVDDPMLLMGVPRQRPLVLMEHLEGVWVGEGMGEYPPHEPRFQYIQELVIEKAITHGPRELTWAFRSVSRNKETKEGLHSETGFLRFQPQALGHGRMELIAVSYTGLAEIDEGTYTDDSFDVWTRFGGLTRPQSASRPFTTEIRRWCEIRPQNTPMTMDYRVEMATERSPMQQYLLSRLRKQEPGEQK
mmetsp:Transcript_65710/g.140551  ORF Transcript_65710/g.140551 Transcript_65710/m.140551 type:complete len:194 (+) Transcript_65710:128-709(+)